MSNRKRYLILALAVVFILVPALAGCGEDKTPAAEEASPSAPPEPKTLVVGVDISSGNSMDPHNHFELPGGLANSANYEPLVKITADDWTNVVPGVAESWDVSDDGVTYTFHLNPDVTFSSGNRMTAEDVRFSWMRLQNKKGPASWFMGWVKDVEVVDDHTVKVILNEPSPAFLKIATTPYLAVLDSAVLKEHGGTDAPDAETTDTATAWLDQNSAGTGPFVLTSWTPKVEIVMEANPNYWGEKPKVDRIIFRHVEDPTTGLQMVQRGDLDMLLRLDPDLVDEAKADTNLNVEIVQALEIMSMSMTCDPEMSEPLSDQRVRQAILLAIDRDGIIESVLGGYALKPPTVLPLGLEGVDPKMVQERDLEKAKALLKEAGYEDGFTATLSYGGRAPSPLVAPKIQSDLAEIGITVELDPMEQSLLVSKSYGEHVVPWLIIHWIPDYIDYTIYSDYWGYSDHDWGENMHCQVPPELEEASLAIAHELDPAKRLQAVKDWQEIMIEFAYGTAVYQPNEILVMSKDVKGFGYLPVAYTDWGVIDISQ